VETKNATSEPSTWPKIAPYAGVNGHACRRTIEDRRGGGCGYVPARAYPNPIRLESPHTTRRSWHQPQDRGELARCLCVVCPGVRGHIVRKKNINSLEFGEYSDPRESQHDISVSAAEHRDGESPKNIGSREICEKT
jgi:hypothetical protein